MRLREGTIVDSSVIEAQSSTKNRSGERDPEIHQAKKGNQWYFGMKVHVGVDADTGLVHSVSAMAANAQDVTDPHNLLHGGETEVWCDAGYQGVHKREEDLGREVGWQAAMRTGQRRYLDQGSDAALAERFKASVRAKVEHPFLKLKQWFGYGKVRYRGLAKNTRRLAHLPGLGNLMTAEGQLAARHGGNRPESGNGGAAGARRPCAGIWNGAYDSSPHGQQETHINGFRPNNNKTIITALVHNILR